jgi:hypothetical protein
MTIDAANVDTDARIKDTILISTSQSIATKYTLSSRIKGQTCLFKRN